MVIRIYWASVTGNRKIAGEQARLRNLVESLKIESEWIDITTSQDIRQKMRSECGKSDGMPPQIFSDNEYLGDIDDMEVAVEDGKVREWFHVPVDVEGAAEEDKKVKSEQDVADKSASPTTTEASTKFVSATATIQAAPQKSVVHAKVRANVVFPRSKTNHVEKSTLDEERKRKLTGL